MYCNGIISKSIDSFGNVHEKMIGMHCIGQGDDPDIGPVFVHMEPAKVLIIPGVTIPNGTFTLNFEKLHDCRFKLHTIRCEEHML